MSRTLLQRRPRRRKPSWKVFLLSGLGFAIAIAIVAWQLGSPGVASYPLDVALGASTSLREPQSADRRVGATTIETAAGSTRLLPVVETFDPDDPAFTGLFDEWQRLQPKLVLVEGSFGLTFGTTGALVRKHGLAGAIVGFARKWNAAVYSLNPSAELVYRTLSEKYSAGDIVLYASLREYHSGQPGMEKSDALMEEVLARQCSSFGLDNCVFGSIAAVDDYWGRAYPRLPNWRQLDDLHLSASPTSLDRKGIGVGDDASLAPIATAYERIFDEYAIASVQAATRSGERVLVVANPERLGRILPALLADRNRQRSFLRESVR